MTNTENRQPNCFYKTSDTSYIGSYISLEIELQQFKLTYSHTSRNMNEVWTVSTPSPRTGVLVPIGSATLMQPEAEGEGPYFLGRLEDPNGLNVPFKIAPLDPSDPVSPWALRYNPPMPANTSAQSQQGAYQRPQRRGFAQQRPTALGPSTGVGGFSQSSFGRSSGHGFNGPTPNGFAGHDGSRERDESPF